SHVMELSMPLEEAMRTQRAIRRLKPDPVDDALVLHLVELALKAPTGSNAQSWEFVVVRDRAVKERLGKLNRQAWSLYGGVGRPPYTNHPGLLRVLETVRWQGQPFPQTPGPGGPRPSAIVSPGRGGAVRARHAPAVPPHRGVEPARLDLSVHPESPAGGTGGRARCCADHLAAVEHLARAPGARPADQRHPLRGGAARLAAR